MGGPYVPDPNADTGTAIPRTSISIPADVAEYLSRLAGQVGIPFSYLAALVYQGIGNRPGGWTQLKKNPNLALQIASQLSSIRDQSRQPAESDTAWGGTAAGPNPPTMSWEDAAVQLATGGVSGNYADIFRTQIQGLTASGAWTISPNIDLTGGTAAPLIPGLTDDQAYDIERIADSTFLQYLGRRPTNAEYNNMVRNGWDMDKITDWLRSQPYGDTGQNLGQFSDLKSALIKAFQTTLGRDPTAAEVHFALVNNIPTRDAGALAEQIKTGTVWGTDPDHYRAMRTRIEQVLGSYGINVTDADVSNDLVNQAAKGNWTDQQIAEAVGKGQRPGMTVGVTNDQYKNTRDMAKKVWDVYFPNKPLSDTELQKMLTMTPDQITQYIRAIPSDEALAIGKVVSAGTYHDVRDAAQQALSNLGFVGMVVDPADVALFSSQKMLTTEAIMTHYKTRPDLVAQQPGLPYGLSKEEYDRQRKEIIGYAQNQGQNLDDAALGEAFNEKMAPAEVEAGLSDFQKRLGRAPTASEVAQFRTKPKDKLEQDQGFVGSKTTPLGPTSTIGDPNKASTSPFARKK